MNAQSPGLIVIPESPWYSTTPNASNHKARSSTPATRCTFKSKTTLRQFCTDILPLEIGGKGIKNAVESRLANPFRRDKSLQWPPAKYQDPEPSLCSIDPERHACVSPKSSASKTTLVGSLTSTATEESRISTQSLGQQTISTLSETNTSFVRHRPEPRHMSVAFQGYGRDPFTEERFFLRRHPQFADVLEILSCQRSEIVYRRILHRGKLWCTSFHRVRNQPQQAAVHGFSAMPIHEPVVSYHADFAPSQGSCTRYMSSSPGYQPPQPLLLASSSFAPSSFAPSSFSTTGSNSQRRQSWSPPYPRTFELDRLWEISSPQPGVFPLHCRDTRGVLDPVPLTPMVLDRHQFCYRFYLSGTKMRWQARRIGRSTVELQCFVRSSVVALLLFGGHGADALRFDAKRHRWRNKGDRSADYPPAFAEPDALPSIVILPAAFSKLAPVDATIVESFVLFTGIEVFECFCAA